MTNLCNVTFEWGKEGTRTFMKHDDVYTWIIKQPYTLLCKSDGCVGAQVPVCSWSDKSSTAEIQFTLADVGVPAPSQKCDGENFWPKGGIPDFAYIKSVSIPFCHCEPTITWDGVSINRRDSSPTAQDMHNLNQQIKQAYQRNIRRQLNN